MPLSRANPSPPPIGGCDAQRHRRQKFRMFSKNMTFRLDEVLWQAMQNESAARRTNRVDRFGKKLRLAAGTAPKVGVTNKYAEGYPASATTAVASMWISLRAWPSIAPSSYLARPTLTSSRTPVRRPMPPVYLALLSPGDTILGMSLRARWASHARRQGQFFRKLFNPCSTV